MNMMTVADASEFIRGITFKPHELIDPSDPDAIVCMRTKNIQADLDERDLIAVPSRLVRNEQKLLREGDILISSANSWELVGKCSFVPELPYRATAGGFIAIVRPNSRTHPRFLYHWLNSPATQHDIRNMGRQTTNISNLDVNRFKGIELPAYEFDEQRRIAAILDKADAIRRKREQALTLADDFLRSVFLEMFGDQDRTSSYEDLGPHLDFVTSGSRGWARYYSKTGARFIRSLDVQMNEISDEDVVYVEPPPSAEADRARVKLGDVLLTITGSRIGRVTDISELSGDAYISQHVAIMRPRQSILPSFLSFFLSSESLGQRQIESMQYGQTKPGLNLQQIRSFKLPVPPLEKQIRFTNVLANVRRHKVRSTQQCTQADDLFNALTQRAFAGDL